MTDSARVRPLNDAGIADGVYVLYWMERSQRAQHNPALDYAVAQANELDQPCVVAFVLEDSDALGYRRHAAFMLQGLAETATALADRGLKMLGLRGDAVAAVARCAADASLVVCDVGYLRHQRAARKALARELDRRVVAVEGDVVVPVRLASDRAESAARTLRPKIRRHLARFLSLSDAPRPAKSSLPLAVKGDVDLRRGEALLEELAASGEVPASALFTGGTTQARRCLTRFLRSRLAGYADARNDPADPCVSGLSPYLHFGQISPVEVACKVSRAGSGSKADADAFLEELVVRRELAVNHVHYQPRYDSYRGLPEWARASLAAHKDDERPHRYTRRELEHGCTHDRYWNAAMREGRLTGYMHNHMRMYWGKKILEWTNTPQYAYSTILHLNNKYFLDGWDPSSYANVAWILGLHDRGWPERPVFGKVRYMNAAGLERKFDIEGYVRRVAELEEG